MPRRPFFYPVGSRAPRRSGRPIFFLLCVPEFPSSSWLPIAFPDSSSSPHLFSPQVKLKAPPPLAAPWWPGAATSGSLARRRPRPAPPAAMALPCGSSSGLLARPHFSPRLRLASAREAFAS